MACPVRCDQPGVKLHSKSVLVDSPKLGLVTRLQTSFLEAGHKFSLVRSMPDSNTFVLILLFLGIVFNFSDSGERVTLSHVTTSLIIHAC